MADRGGPCDGDEVDRFTAVEVGAALGLSTRTARDRVGLATDLVTRQPALLAAMRDGVVGTAHARAVREALDPVADVVVARTVVADVVEARSDLARSHGLPRRLGVLGTPSEVAAAVRRDVTRAGVDSRARCEAARARRLVSSWALSDGMAALQVMGPAVTIAAAMSAVDARARELVGAARAAAASEPRVAPRAAGAANREAVVVPTLDQARADAVLDALTGSSDLERRPGHVDLGVTVLVPLEVLAPPAPQGASTGGSGRRSRPAPPAELPGYGPLPDEVAKAVARAARRVTVVPLDGDGHVATSCAPGGDVVAPDRVGGGCGGAHPGSDVYRPAAAVERAVRARDMTCRWPGCRTRTERCDVDHTVPFPEGSTAECNLACLCRLHHRVKHRAGWFVSQPGRGRLDLISPTGRVYVTAPVVWQHRRGGWHADARDGDPPEGGPCG